MSADRELRYFERSARAVDRCRLVFVFLAVAASFTAGVYYSRTLPRTLFSRPVETLRLMKDYPVGTDVYPLSTRDAREHFKRYGWGDEPAVIVGYEAVTFKEEDLMLCNIKTHRGAGLTLAVNPQWIARSNQNMSK